MAMKMFTSSDIEDTYFELHADCTALLVLFDAWHNHVDFNRNDLQGLCWDRLSLLEQHLFDLGILTGMHTAADTDACSVC